MDRLKADELLKLFEMAQDVANVGYWEWDISTNEVLWSDTKIEIYGEDAQEYEPTFEKFLAVIDEETKKRVLNEIDSVLSGKKRFYDLQHKIRLKSGKVAWVQEKGFVVRDAEGKPLKMVGIVYDITDKMVMLEELKIAEAQSKYLKTHDLLTTLYNKETLLADIEKKIDAKTPFSVIFLDIDNFKTINNSFGHTFGDEVIKRLGQMLQSVIECGFVYRYGGDEFVILTDDLCLDAKSVVVKIEELFQRNISVAGKTLQISFSMGVCSYPGKAQNARDMVKNANSALALAKSDRKGRALFYEEYMSNYIAQKRKILDSLNDAVKDEKFTLFYQPKVDCVKGEIIGFEALVRWRNEDGDLISPGLFLPIAHEYGLMGKIDFIVLKKALVELKRWHERGFKITLSVNFNMSDFENRDILVLLEEADLLEFVTVEITENELMSCSEKDMAILEWLKQLGLKISLDDFGTGYSSLRYIHKLPIDELKIDRAFVEHIPGDSKDEAMVQIIKSIVETFGLGCVVEGVERREQKEFFKKIGLTTIQGFYYGKPVDAKEATLLLERGTVKEPFNSSLV